MYDFYMLYDRSNGHFLSLSLFSISFFISFVLIFSQILTRLHVFVCMFLHAGEFVEQRRPFSRILDRFSRCFYCLFVFFFSISSFTRQSYASFIAFFVFVFFFLQNWNDGWGWEFSISETKQKHPTLLCWPLIGWLYSRQE